jgi:Lon protease-like protein
MSEDPSVLLSLFPLPNVVLFPGMPLPLHIFEPRYRRMIADALETCRTIGMTHLRPGWEAEYADRPALYPVGCAGLIERHEALDDGRCNILLRGQSRFRILEERLPSRERLRAEAEVPPRGRAPIRGQAPIRRQATQTYRVATVEMMTDTLGDAAVLDGLRRKILAAVARAPDGPATLVLQGEVPHELLVNGLSQSLALAPVEKQSLLDCDTIEARALRLLEILDFHRLERNSGGRTAAH